MALTGEQHEFLNFCEQYWYEHGSLPTQEYLESVGITNAEHLSKYYGVSDFRSALTSRGISLKGLEHSPNSVLSRVLTEEQLAVANTMLDLRDNRSQKKKLAELGIPTQKWEAWLRDPAFQHYVRTRAENALGDNQHEAHLALIDRVRSGDVSAIKYLNELTGRYVPNKSGNLDISLILMRVIEAIQKHVSSPDEQEAVARELAGLAILAQADTNPVGTVIHQIAGPVKGQVIV